LQFHEKSISANRSGLTGRCCTASAPKASTRQMFASSGCSAGRQRRRAGVWENPEVPPIGALESLKSADSLDCNQPSEPESSAHLDQRVSASAGWGLCCDMVVCVMWGEWGRASSGQWPVASALESSRWHQAQMFRCGCREKSCGDRHSPKKSNPRGKFPQRH
jgi:hypothetical protein